VVRPTSVVFLTPEADAESVIYPVQLADKEGRVWIAVYSVLRVGKEWKVSGCQLFAGKALSV
jgi:hypothetical protein